MGIWADRFVSRMEQQATWPSADDKRVWDQVKTWVAFMESDRNVLREQARWRNQVRQYLVDPLAPKISEAFASTIFGRAPTVTPADPADLELSQNLVRANNLGRRVQREHKRVSSEGETWWRISSNPQIDDAPTVSYHSRLDVIPTFSSNDALRCVAFIDYLYPLEGDGEETVWRHFEVIDAQDIVNVLFHGTDDTPGEMLPLGQHPAVKNLAETVAHDLPMMPAGRVINRETLDVFFGQSDYAGIEDFLYGLNEILTIFHENIRLTLKKRIAVPSSAVDESGTIDVSQEVIVTEPLDRVIGKGAGQSAGASQFEVLQYKSDIDDVVTAQNAEAENALIRVGITPAYIGMSTDKSEGRANTGTALRLRLIPTTNAAEDRAQYWDDSLPVQLQLLQMLDARPPNDPGSSELGGFGRGWKQPEQPPSVERGSSLPEDPIEETEVHSTRVSAAIESRYTAIKSLNPQWSEDQIQEELGRIDDDLSKAQATAGDALAGLFDTGRAPAKVPGVQ